MVESALWNSPRGLKRVLKFFPQMQKEITEGFVSRRAPVSFPLFFCSYQIPGLSMEKWFSSNKKWWAVLYAKPEMNHSSREIFWDHSNQWEPYAFLKEKKSYYVFILFQNSVCSRWLLRVHRCSQNNHCGTNSSFLIVSQFFCLSLPICKQTAGVFTTEVVLPA